MGVTVYILYSAHTRIFFMFGFVQTYYMFSWAVGIRFLNVLPSLDSSLHQLSNAVFQIVLLQKLAKIGRKEYEKSKTMVRLFFTIWIRSNILRDFYGGCRHPIFICRSSLDSSLHQLSNAIFQIVLVQKLAKIGRKEYKKSKTMVRLFFIIWIRSNILRNF